MEGDEYDNVLIGDPNQLQNLIEGNDIENPEIKAENDSDDGLSGEDERKKKTVKRVLNPQPKLDTDRLTGPKGIIAVEGVFESFEFGGAGYEDYDLKRIMKRLELWGNRLFPKLQFDDLLEKLEKLGHKRPVLNLVHKLRMGFLNEDAEEVLDVRVSKDANLDSLPIGDNVFEQILSEHQAQINFQPMQINDLSPETDITITEEQKVRMNHNHKLAQERRLSRIKAQQVMEFQNDEKSLIQNITTEDDMF